VSQTATTRPHARQPPGMSKFDTLCMAKYTVHSVPKALARPLEAPGCDSQPELQLSSSKLAAQLWNSDNAAPKRATGCCCPLLAVGWSGKLQAFLPSLHRMNTSWQVEHSRSHSLCTVHRTISGLELTAIVIHTVCNKVQALDMGNCCRGRRDQAGNR
jgi:hypothetical protein